MGKRSLRKHLAGKSGAEVVKKLLEYQKKNWKTKRQILEEANHLLEEEDILHRKLCEAIQEEEQLRLFELMQPLQQNIEKFLKRLLIFKKIDYTVRDIEKNGNLKYMELFLNKY